MHKPVSAKVKAECLPQAAMQGVSVVKGTEGILSFGPPAPESENNSYSHVLQGSVVTGPSPAQHRGPCGLKLGETVLLATQQVAGMS